MKGLKSICGEYEYRFYCGPSQYKVKLTIHGIDDKELTSVATISRKATVLPGEHLGKPMPSDSSDTTRKSRRGRFVAASSFTTRFPKETWRRTA